MIELPNRLHEADVAFLEKIEHAATKVAMPLGVCHYQPQVCLDKSLLGVVGIRSAATDAFGQIDLSIACQPSIV
jgi:hypothetical protein